MSPWTDEELDAFGAADELQIASLRKDGTRSRWVTIWVVRLGDDLYVRSVRGRTSGWFRAAQLRHRGHIRAGGVEKDVSFVEEADTALNDAIDAAYRTKYGHYAKMIVDSTQTPAARGTTLKLVPRPEAA
jgi:hypothetical protein